MKKITTSVKIAISIFVLILSYVLYTITFDKAVATGNYVEGVVYKIVPITNFSHSKLRGTVKYSKIDVYIVIENNVEIVKRYDATRSFYLRQKIKLREYKSKHRGRISYQVLSY